MKEFFVDSKTMLLDTVAIASGLLTFSSIEWSLRIIALLFTIISMYYSIKEKKKNGRG